MFCEKITFWTNKFHKSFFENFQDQVIFGKINEPEEEKSNVYVWNLFYFLIRIFYTITLQITIA